MPRSRSPPLVRLPLLWILLLLPPSPPSPPAVKHPFLYSLLAFGPGRAGLYGLQWYFGPALTGFLSVLAAFISEVCTVPQPPFPKVSLRQFEGFGG